MYKCVWWRGLRTTQWDLLGSGGLEGGVGDGDCKGVLMGSTGGWLGAGVGLLLSHL